MGMLRTLRAVVRLRRPERSRSVRRLRSAANVDDLRRMARRRLPAGVFDYIDGGAEDESALERNTGSFAAVGFRPRVLRGLGDLDTSTTLLGRPLAFPLVLAPTGFTRIADPAGELAVVRAAGRAGIPFTLSTMGTRSIEECASVAPAGARLWFQVYAWRDRDLIRAMVERAAAANFEALCLTVDTAVLGRRERDVRRGFTLPPEIGPGTFIDGLRHPGWTWRFLRSDPIRFANVEGSDRVRGGPGDGSTAVDLAAYMGSQFDHGLSWKDVEWLRSVWEGPVLVKGIPARPAARTTASSPAGSAIRVKPVGASTRGKASGRPSRVVDVSSSPSPIRTLGRKPTAAKDPVLRSSADSSSAPPSM